MKKNPFRRRKNIYQVTGIVLVCFNLAGCLGIMLSPETIPDAESGNPGYIIGENIFFIFGGFFLYRAYLLQKKIKQWEILEAVNGIGQDEPGV